MDNFNVLDNTKNISKLDEDMSNWKAMSFNARHESNKVCYEKYYMNMRLLSEVLHDQANQSYERIKTITEAESVRTQGEMINKYDISFNLQKDEGIIIINPVIDYNTLDLESLEKKFNKYLELPEYLRQMSDNHSMELWGSSVIDMYNKLKDDYESYQSDKLVNIPLDDLEFQEYVQDITNEVKDPLRRKMRLLESYDFQKYTDRVIVESVIEDTKESVPFDSDLPEITAWFTPDEMRDKFGIDVNPYTYLTRNSVQLRKDITNSYDKDSLIKLGWNPSVEFNESSIKYARERQINWLNETRKIQIVDLSRFITESISPNELVDDKSTDLIDEVIEPVYIVLLQHGGIDSKVIRGLTKSNYSHAGLSFDEKMNRVYSFNANTVNEKGGFSVEGIDFWNRAKDVKLKILTFFVTKSIKEKMKEKVDWFIKNQSKTKYDYSDIFRIALNKFKDSSYSLSMICSQFTDNILKLVNIDITGKPSNLVVPGDFDKVKNPKIFCLFNDYMEKFKPANLRKAINSILKKRSYKDIAIIPLKEAIEIIFNGDIEGFYYNTDNDKANKILEEMREMIAPTVLIEAKRIPIGFDKKSNLYIDLPKDLEIEYQESHRLLTSYSNDNIQGIKHQLARLFYINSIIEKKIKKMKNGDKDYKNLVDLRARVINDFKKYFSVVQNVEPNFDFENYIKNSEYYDKTVIIDRHTLKYTGKTIKEIIKLMM